MPLQQLVRNLWEAVEDAEPGAAFVQALSEVTLGIDLDNTIAYFSNQALALLNGKFGTTYVFDDLVEYRLGSMLPKEQLDWIVEQWSEDVFNHNMAPNTFAINCVRALFACGYRVVIVSDRPRRQQEPSEWWLHRWEVPHHECRVFEGSKEAMAAEGSPDRPMIFIDDNPYLADQLPRPGVELLLLRKPWTPPSFEAKPGVRICEDWPDLMGLLPGLELAPAAGLAV